MSGKKVSAPMRIFSGFDVGLSGKELFLALCAGAEITGGMNF
jgi:hypothetical protein